MYRRLIMFALAVCASALVALVVPLGLAARDIVQTDKLSQAADHARQVANTWENTGQASLPGSDSGSPASNDGTVTLITPDGEVLGEPPASAASRAVSVASVGGGATQMADGFGYVTAPAYLDDRFGVVLVTMSPTDLRDGLVARLAALGAVSLVLLGFAGSTAWWLARRTAAPLQVLVTTANTVADGDLAARAPHSSVAEIEQVGFALNRLTGRVQELLEAERLSTAELAHQLRTPLTVLSVDVDGVAEADVRVRLRDDLEYVHRMVDEIIDSARRSGREGLDARCDAGQVARERVAFWQVLAEDQGRAFDNAIPDEVLPVRLTRDDLVSAVDILFQNVFLHTPEGAALGLSVANGDGRVRLTVWDGGPGFAERGRDEDQAGSTGLGLSIAARLAEASGGCLAIRSDAGRGAAVTLELGPPAD